MLRAAKHLFYAVLATASLTVGGCGWFNDPAPDVHVVGEMVNLAEKSEVPPVCDIYNPAWKRINLAAAANETVSFQLVVDAGEDGLDDVHVAVDPLTSVKGKIDASNVRIYRMKAVSIGVFPAWYLRLSAAVPQPMKVYDALVPSDLEGAGQPYDLAAGERLALWVDVSVPREAVKGDYTGRIRLAASDREEWSVELALKVHGFVLPDAPSVATVGGFDDSEIFAAFFERDGKPYRPVYLDRTKPEIMEGLALLRELMVMAREHRLDLFDRGLHPLLKRDGDGHLRVVWDDYDAIVTPYLSGSAFADRLGVTAWPMPFSQNWPNPSDYGGADAKPYTDTVANLLAQSQEHFKQLNASKQVFLWPWRGAVSQGAYARQTQLIDLARAVDRTTPLLTTLPVAPPAETQLSPPPGLAERFDMIAPPAQWASLHRVTTNATSSPGLTGLWLSPGTPPYLPSLGVLATSADVRSVPWFAMKYNCRGLFLPEVLNWSSDLSGGAGAETRLFYPGTIVGRRAILPSVRLKRLRRGLQDTAYLQLLTQRGRTGIARTMLDAMTRYAGLDATGDNYQDVRLNGWVKDARTWRMARRLMAAELEVAIDPTKRMREQLLGERVAWKQFEQMARRVQVERVQTFLQPSDRAAAGDKQPLVVRILLDVYNEYSQPMNVTAKIDPLPKGWSSVGTTAEIKAMPAASRRTVELAAVVDNIPPTQYGKIHVPVTVTVDGGSPEQIDVPVGLLRAGTALRPLVIDGEPREWPLREGNTAGAFRLIGRRGDTGGGLADQQTLAFVLHDDDNLYIAFRCQQAQSPMVRADNRVRYEQLMACGEDLVEVVLDPGGRARDVSDLYHIVVKPNGVVVAERGVGTRPPLGRHVVWSAGIQAAVAQSDGVWFVEIAIPLAAFGPEGRERFWRINFSRYAVPNAESSNWAEASRYLYDTKNLGTMIFVDSGE